MPTLDDMFGKPGSAAVPAPTDILPNTSVTQTGANNPAGRDVMLVASPFSAESRAFFNKDADERKLAVPAPASGDFTEVLEPLPPGAPLPASVARAGDPLAEALSPGLPEVAKFGIPFGANDSFNEGEIRETLRRILRRL